jgi:hypothetical protein
VHGTEDRLIRRQASKGKFGIQLAQNFGEKPFPTAVILENEGDRNVSFFCNDIESQTNDARDFNFFLGGEQNSLA